VSRILDTILKLESYLARERPELLDALLPGLTTSQIDEIVSNFPFRLPLEIYELYQWRNGIDVEGSYNPLVKFLPESPFFLNLEFCIKEYDRLMSVKDSGGDAFDDEALNPKWFPLISFDQTYFLTIGNSLQQSTSEIIYIWADEWEASPCYESLTSMLLTVIECSEAGVYYFDGKGTMQSKYPTKEDKIYRKYNPSICQIL